MRQLLGWLGSALAGSALLVYGLAWLVPLPERLELAGSTPILFQDGSLAYVFLSPDDRYRIGVHLDEVDPDYIEALLRYEDKRFYWHLGVDPLAVLRAALVNFKFGRVVSGGSTITMQLVRLLEPRPRTLRSKLIEAVRAMQLELRLSKGQILEAYLRYTSYGNNLEGIQTASYAYFGHGARALSAAEIATLLAVPQKPGERFPCPANRERLKAARNEIAAWLVARGGLPRQAGGVEVSAEELLREIRESPVVHAVRPLPRWAPHAAQWLKRRSPGASRIETSLDRAVQSVAERLVQGARDEMRAKGIYNGAVVIVEHTSGRVRALVGNLDFFDRHSGQVIGFDEPRSPGSALKPFIYAMAIDRGLALPEQLVADIPVSYGGYAPDNYDGRFQGLVPLEDALSRSLNVPFVGLLGRVGVERFLGMLRSAGVSSLEDKPGYYGLSAAIGAVEITPLELAGLYAALAHQGRARPLTWLATPSSEGAEQRLFSRGAAYLTRRALARRDRPDFPERRRFSGAPAAIHWKTGTSYGHRDAWACGSGPRYTAVVWLGNLDNRPSLDLVGAEAAGPLLFDLLESLASRSRWRLPDNPTEDLRPIEVCSYSGYLPNPACESTKRVLALTEHVPTKTCPYHVAFDMDRQTGWALNPSCRGGHDFVTRTYLVWPASIRRWLGEHDRWVAPPPALDPSCRVSMEAAQLEILSPPSGQVMSLLPGVPAHRQEIPLEAEAIHPSGRLHWFVDGAYLGSVAPEARLWWTPTPGRHEFLVMDEAGLRARRRLDVRGRSH